ncbi:hypothetical protein Tco_0407673 [Tanacetum coccineum]
MLLVRVVPPVESCSTIRNLSRGFVPSNDGSRILGGLGYAGRTRKGKGGVLVFRKVYVRSLADVRGFGGFNLKQKLRCVAVQQACLVAKNSCVRRSVSGGWLSSPVVSRRGGMAADELRMKAPNDGTTTSTGEERKS